MNSKPEPGVAAPCGLCCDNRRDDESGELQVCGSAEFCPSHFGREGCEIYQCATRRGMTDCGDCAEFPCARLLLFAHSGPARLPLILNLQRRRRLGHAQWSAEERAFWQQNESACQWARLQRVLAEKRCAREKLQAQIQRITHEVERAMRDCRVDAPVQRVGSQV